MRKRYLIVSKDEAFGKELNMYFVKKSWRFHSDKAKARGFYKLEKAEAIKAEYEAYLRSVGVERKVWIEEA